MLMKDVTCPKCGVTKKENQYLTSTREREEEGDHLIGVGFKCDCGHEWGHFDDIDNVPDTDLVFFHSQCCKDHWELVYHRAKNEYRLCCLKCGKPAGGITITGPDHIDTPCACCSKEPDGK